MPHSSNGWNEPLGPIEGFVFDLDGTLILSNRSLGSYRALPGAVEILAWRIAISRHSFCHPDERHGLPGLRTRTQIAGAGTANFR